MLTSSVLSLPTSTAAVERHDLVKRGKKFAACFTLKEKEELPGEAEGLPDDLYGCGGLQALQKFRGSGVPYIYIPQAVFDDPENNACDRWVTISDSKGGALSGMIVGGKLVYFGDAIVRKKGLRLTNFAILGVFLFSLIFTSQNSETNGQDLYRCNWLRIGRHICHKWDRRGN